MTSALRSLAASLTPRSSSTNIHAFQTAKEGSLFPKTDPAIDGEECLHDCESCTVHLPKKFSIDEEEELYGHVKGWSTHLIVATGKTDWVRDVCDEAGSVMEAVGKAKEPSNGKMMLSASNMPLPHHSHSHAEGTTVLLLPSFKFIDNVTPSAVPDLITHIISSAPTNTTPLSKTLKDANNPSSTSPQTEPPNSDLQTPNIQQPLPHNLTLRDCPHAYLILLCSQATRDARCGQSAPLLRKELERHLRPLGLYRDLDDQRPGGVGIYFISHVGGHKFSANVMIYRRASAEREAVGPSVNGEADGVRLAEEAAQLIWLARIRPEDCENLVRFTVLQGKVVKPERQLRGGFDRSKRLTSW